MKSAHQRVFNDLYRSRLVAVVRPGSSPTPSPVIKLDRQHTGRMRKRDNLLKKEGVRGGEGAKSYDSEKAWSSINHSILSAVHYPVFFAHVYMIVLTASHAWLKMRKGFSYSFKMITKFTDRIIILRAFSLLDFLILKRHLDFHSAVPRWRQDSTRGHKMARTAGPAQTWS
jgi:hypothetical protein